MGQSGLIDSAAPTKLPREFVMVSPEPRGVASGYAATDYDVDSGALERFGHRKLSQVNTDRGYVILGSLAFVEQSMTTKLTCM